MSKDPVLQLGDPVLREVAKPVAKKDIGSRTLNALLRRMKAVLEKEPYGVALAAPQVGKALRLFIVSGRVFAGEAEGEKALAPRVFINPEVVRASKAKKEMGEGCLSVRGKYGTVLRHEKMSIKALDEYGKPLLYHGSGLIAQIFQHELDHLEGVLYVDKAEEVVDEEDIEKLRDKKTKAA